MTYDRAVVMEDPNITQVMKGTPVRCEASPPASQLDRRTGSYPYNDDGQFRGVSKDLGVNRRQAFAPNPTGINDAASLSVSDDKGASFPLRLE